MVPSKFLSAEWRNLVMLNYVIDPQLLEPWIPAGLELDLFGGEAFVSVVGFQFFKTRILGVPIPWHCNFEEVNLRFYVRRRAGQDWRRGVVFIRELVPRRLIALVARAVYGEPYQAVPMGHQILRTPSVLRCEYWWERAGSYECLSAQGQGEPQAIGPGTLEEFITEHYWGYNSHGVGSREYQVEHPRWRVLSAGAYEFQADVEALYGKPFVSCLSVPPASAFIAEGSAVVVRRHAATREGMA